MDKIKEYNANINKELESLSHDELICVVRNLLNTNRGLKRNLELVEKEYLKLTSSENLYSLLRNNSGSDTKQRQLEGF